MTAETPSLAISLAADVTRVRLIARPGLEDHLRRLAVGFQTSTQRSPGSIEIELDDLLTNLGAFSSWPHQADGDVDWDAQIRALVVDSLKTRKLSRASCPARALLAQWMQTRSPMFSARSGRGT